RISRQPLRYPALDSARFVLIALVVSGHLLEQLVDAGPFAAALYRWIYLFHMPAFVLISGAVSKPALTRRRVVALITCLLLPYVLFQTLYAAWDAWLFQTGDWPQGYLTPYWLLWYLPSLACWIGYPLSLSRTLVFFPLFLLGHRLGAKRLQQLGDSRGRRWGALAILTGAAVGAWLLRDADPQWLYASVGYADLNVVPWPGAALRLALLAVSGSCVLAVLALMPRHAMPGTPGRRSLTAYLMHGFLVRALVAGGAFTWLAHALPAFAEVSACLVAGVLVAAALSTRMADLLAAPLTRPVDWMRDAVHRGPLAIRQRMEEFKRLY